MKVRVLFAALSLALASSTSLLSQVTPDMAQGLSPFAEYIPSGIDNVNPANGNVFLKIPLLSYPQRGGKVRLDYSIYYNDKQWELPVSQVNGVGSTQYNGRWNLGDPSSQTGFSMTVGAYIARDQYAQFGTDANTYSYTYGGAAYESFVVTTQLYAYYVLSADGGKHFVGDAFWQTCTPQGGAGICPTEPGEVYEYYPATDATGWDQYGHDPNGISYVVQSSGTLPSKVVDPNGNAINASSTALTDTYNRVIPGTMTGPGALPFPNSPRNPTTGQGGWDLIPGVPASVPSQCPAGTTSARVWTVPGSQSFTGDSRNSAGTGTYYLCYTLYSYQTAFNANAMLPAHTGVTYGFAEASSTGTGTDGQALMLTAVELPNGRAYTFAYDQYLSLTQLGLPSGATISYSWQNVMFKTDPAETSAPISRALKTRTVNPGNGQPSSKTAYHWDIMYASNGTIQFPAYSIITDANGNDEEHTLGGVDDGGNSWNDYVDLGVASYTGCSPHDNASDKSCSPATGTNMKAETYTLTAFSSGGAAYGTLSYVPALGSLPPTTITQITARVPSSAGERLSRVSKTLVPNYGSCTVYTYPVTIYSGNSAESGIQNNGGGSAPAPTSQSYSSCYSTGQIATVSTYDLGAAGSGLVGPLMAKETISYAWQSSPSVLSANTLNLVGSSVTTDGSGGWAAETDMCYDSHENQTSLQKFATQPTTHSCTSPPSNAIVTSSTYNSQGVVTATKDANGNPTTITALTCNGALAQSITLADGNQAAYVYDCNTGKVTSVKDQNDITRGTSTTYTYNDSLARLTSVSTPDGGGFQVNYHGDALPLNMTVTTLTGETAGSNATTKVYDGLAREIHSYQTDSISTSIPDTITVDTNYDAMGHIASVSNPYRSTSNGSTTYTYDAINRQIKVTHLPDNTYQSWSYDGPSVTFTDETGNQWKRTSDGMGRLTQALEPNGASRTPSMPTNYTYDALGNLKTVSQTGISGTDSPRATRSFQYDGLSRLIAAYNPENSNSTSGAQLTCAGASGKWALCYSYDSNGNEITRTDNRGVSITHAYDKMNRLLSKTYSSGDPSVCRQYNVSASSASDLYPVGNLTMEWTQPGSCPTTAQTSVPSSAYNSRIVLKHDAMNRVQSEQQCPFAPCSAAYKFNYGYDLAGNVTSSNNGMPTSTSSTTAPAIAWGAAYDTANRLSLVTVASQPWSDSAHPPVLFQANQNTYSTFGSVIPYDPFGHLVAAQLGTTTSTAPSNSAINMQSQYDVRGRIQSESYSGRTGTTSATGSVGSITLSGAEKTTTGTPKAASATVTISGSEGVTTYYPCGIATCPTTLYDAGNVSLTVNGGTVSYYYSNSSYSALIASSLASSVNSAGMPVTATVSGSVITLTATTAGTAGNSITISAASSTQYPQYFSYPSFPATTSGSTLTGGSAGGTIYDSGTVSVTINSKTATASWGSGSTSSSLASALASAVNTGDSAFLTASSSGSVIALTSVGTGSATNWPIQVSTTYDSHDFSSASYAASASGMSGGTNGSPAYTAIYSYSVPSSTGGYSKSSNILAYSDSVTGTWNSTSAPITYDTLNRLTQMYAVSGPRQGQYGCWSYDSFGNRTLESFQTTPCSPSATATVQFNHWNQVITANGSAFSYDLAGNVLADSLNGYAYDVEGRLCAVKNYNGTYYQYLYDAEGQRVAKGLQTSLHCPAPTVANGFTLQYQYLLGLASDQVTELDSLGGWKHSNAFAGELLATYSSVSPAFAFHIADPVGSRRVLADASGAKIASCQNLPYGNGETCSPTPTEHLFTGKERDQESGNDYFPMRYYSSAMGQWLSADPAWAQASSASDPQSLNEYVYVGDNPLKMVDPDGTCAVLIAGIHMSPTSQSGAKLLTVARDYGADVAFPYASETSSSSGPSFSAENRLLSIGKIGLARLGANSAATKVAKAATNAAFADAKEGGTSYFALALSGGAQATISAGALKLGTTDFYDPGIAIGQRVPDIADYVGTKGITSPAMDSLAIIDSALTLAPFSPGFATAIGCGHDLSCAIEKSDDLKKALIAAGPCKHRKVFVRGKGGPAYLNWSVGTMSALDIWMHYWDDQFSDE